MTKYIFDVTSFPSLSKNKPKQMIIFCHGYGGDGRDISVLANSWRRFLPDAVFLCPNAPEVCTVNPLGYQWFDMAIENDEKILYKTLHQKFHHRMRVPLHFQHYNLQIDLIIVLSIVVVLVY